MGVNLELCTKLNMRTMLFWAIMQQVVAVTDVSGQPISPIFKVKYPSFLTLADGTNRLYQHIGRELLSLTAQ